METKQKALAKPVKLTKEQLSIVKSQICPDLTDDELALYFYYCQRHGVHPLDKLVFAVPRKVKGQRVVTFQASIDLLRARAADTGEYAGSDDPVFTYKDDTDIPISATVTVYRLVKEQRCPFTATARWKEYYPGDELGWMWRQKPHVMLGKCAEALALRKAFPQELYHLYVEEELQKPSEDIPREVTATIPSSPKAVSEEAEVINQESKQAQGPKQSQEQKQGQEPPKRLFR